MFERFTDRARRVVVLAQEEARLLDHNYIGTEHLLLGLVREEGGVAAHVLESLGIRLADARGRVEEIIGRGPQPAVSGHIPFTPRAKKVLELSLREAKQLSHGYIGTEHILLGLVREGEGVAAQVLLQLGADLETTRSRVLDAVAGGLEAGRAVEPRRGVYGVGAASPSSSQCSFCGRDLWEVDHYVARSSASMCAVCIAAASGALDAASDDQQRLTLPPRVFGDAPVDDPGAVESISAALEAVFGAELGERTAAALEDGERILPVLLEARARHPDIRVADVVVERVRFSAVAATVGFELVLDNGGRVSFVGPVARVGDRWVVTRATVADVLRTGGISLPPAADAS